MKQDIRYRGRATIIRFDGEYYWVSYRTDDPYWREAGPSGLRPKLDVSPGLYVGDEGYLYYISTESSGLYYLSKHDKMSNVLEEIGGIGWGPAPKLEKVKPLNLPNWDLE